MTKITVPQPDEYSFQFEHQPSSILPVPVERIKDLEDGTQVTVKGKVHSIGQPYHTRQKHLKVCEIVIGDTNGVAKVDAWENFIPKFEIGHCYTISPVQVRSWKGTKKFSIVINSEVVEIKDDQKLIALQAPAQEDNADIDNTNNVQVKLINSIEKIEKFLRCDKCGKKVLQPTSSPVCHCDYCRRHMRAIQCTKDVCVNVPDAETSIDKPGTKHQLLLTVFGNILEASLDGDFASSPNDDIACQLLELKDIFITYDSSTMIVSTIF